MKYNILLLILIVFSFSSCDDYLDLVPENDILSIKSIFEKKSTALKFLNGAYQPLGLSKGDLKRDPSMCGCDEFMTGEYSRNLSYSSLAGGDNIPAFKIAEGLQNPLSPILGVWGKRAKEYITPNSDRYEGIRSCNTFIDNVDNVYNMTDLEKTGYKAEAMALKAFHYFELIKFYGPIVLVPENIDVKLDVESMKKPRSHVDTCFKEVVRLLDKAIPHLKSFGDQSPDYYGNINKEAAYACKAQVLLFAASPLFNGNPWYADFTNSEGEKLFSDTYDEKKWEKAAKAADEAVKYCEGIGRSLYDETTDQKTDKLNTIRNIQKSALPDNFNSSELLFGLWIHNQYKQYQLVLPRYNSEEYNFNNNIKGNVNPSMRMVELFYTDKGLPLDMDKSWGYEDRYNMGVEKNEDYNSVVILNQQVLNLHLRREPRFYADIACDKTYWERGYNKVVMNPYQGGSHGNSQNRLIPNAVQNLTGYWVKKLVPTKVKGGKYPSLGLDIPFPFYRLAEMYMIQAEAWNEFEGPSNKVFDALNKVRKRAGIPTVQDSWINYSKNPSQINSKEGLRKIIRQERMIEFAFEGHRFWDLRRWKEAHIYQNKPLKGWNVFGSDSKAFYNNYNGPIVVFDKNKFQAPRDYFWPIGDEEILISNVKQNIDW